MTGPEEFASIVELREALVLFEEWPLSKGFKVSIERKWFNGVMKFQVCITQLTPQYSDRGLWSGIDVNESLVVAARGAVERAKSFLSIHGYYSAEDLEKIRELSKPYQHPLAHTVKAAKIPSPPPPKA